MTVTEPQNIDIIFGDVDYIELPQILFGLEIVEAGPDDRRKAEGGDGRPRSRATG